MTNLKMISDIPDDVRALENEAVRNRDIAKEHSDYAEAVMDAINAGSRWGNVSEIEPEFEIVQKAAVVRRVGNGAIAFRHAAKLAWYIGEGKWIDSKGVRLVKPLEAWIP